MGVRLEKVILELEDTGFSTKMVKDAAATALLAKELDKLGKTGTVVNRRLDGMSDRIDKNTKSLGAMNAELGRSSSGLGALADVHLARTSTAAGRADSSINQLTGRLRAYADAAAILGPGLIPIGALAAPAVTGLASSFGFAAAGALSLVVASQGVGDALKALNEAALEPTAANLDKAREAMAKIGPEAQAFVARFQEIRPALKGIRDDAAAGWFPGLTDALDDVERVAPRVGALLETIGQTGGRLVAEGAAGLAGPEGRQFLKFLKTEAPQALSDFGHTIGNTIAGLGELWMAFTPLNRDFSSWMVDASQSFQDWAKGLSETEGFREFVDYVRTNGPKVAAFAAAAADAFLEIVEAAAPLGGPVLESLTAILKVVASIADSDLGTPIFAGVAALALLNRALAVTAGLQTKISGSSAISAGMKSGGLLGGLKAGGAGIVAANRDLKSTAVNAGKATAAIAGLTIATTGMADGLGLSNTASLALLGTLGGPMGVAAGATAGFLLDVKSASDETSDSIKKTKQAIEAITEAPITANSLGFGGGELAKILASQRAELKKFTADVESDNFGEQLGNWLDPAAYANSFEGIFGKSGVEKRQTAIDANVKQIADYRKDYSDIIGSLAEVNSELGGDSIGSIISEPSLKQMGQLEGIATRIQPALDDLHLTLEELDDGNNVERVADRMEYLGSKAGRVDSLNEVLTGLSDVTLTAADRAGLIGTAFDNLIGPGLNASAAFDQWLTTLHAIRDTDLSAGFVGQTDAIIANREAIRQGTSALTERLTADAANGASAKQLTARLAEGRQEIIKSATAAGASEGQVRKYLRTLGLTPKLVQTLFKTQGLTEAEAAVRAAIAGFKKLPANVRTDIKTKGVPTTIAEINALDKKYKLTEKQRTALIRLADQASKPLSDIQHRLEVADRTKANPTLSIDGYPNAMAAIARFKEAIANIPRNVSTTVTTTRSIRAIEEEANGGLHANGVKAFADGGYGEDGRYYARTSQIVKGGANILWGEEETGWEAYISGKPGMRDRNLDILDMAAERLGASVTRYADGGDNWSPAMPPKGIGAPISTTVRTLSEVKQIMADIRDLKRLLDKDGKDELSKQRKKVVALELKAAEKRLKVAEKEEELQNKVRDKLRETRSNLQGVGSSFSLDSLVPDNRPKTVVQGAQATIGQLRRDVVGAGGVWSKDLVRWSKGLLAASSELDDVNAALARETTKRDTLVSSISDQQQALDQLTSTMKAFGDSVAGNFLTNPFGARKPGEGGGSPELVAAQEQLKAIRESATGDSVALAARASELIAQIKRLQGAGGDGEELTGLAKVRKTLLEETAAAEQMTAALAKLASLGLDTAGAMGGLYKSLAESGDLQTAQELAALTAGQVDEYEKLFAARENAAAVLAAQTTQAVYGQQSAALQAGLAAQQAALVAVDNNITKLNAAAEAIGVDIRAMAPGVGQALRPQIDGLRKDVQDVGRDTAERLRRQRAAH